VGASLPCAGRRPLGPGAAPPPPGCVREWGRADVSATMPHFVTVLPVSPLSVTNEWSDL
jgi:hypothetical protein